MAKRGGNQFRAGARFDETALMRLVYCFCQGIGTEVAARSTGLTPKTARGVYLALRKRLLKPAFNRWHGTNRRLLRLPRAEYEVMVRAKYFDVLAGCAGNETCGRNWRLGNRKVRQCRSCPLAEVFTDESRAEAYVLIDTVHGFYERLGIRGEKELPPVIRFHERLIHTTVVGTVQNNSRKLPTGFFDPSERTFLSGGALLDTLLKDLAEEPL